MPEDHQRLPQRRPSLRAVTTTERHVVPLAPVVRPPPAAEEGFLDTLSKLWRHRRMILTCAVIVGGLATFIAWSMPSYYVAEARVLVGVQSPRVLNNAEAILSDVSPDAERVQNEGYVLQSRTLARKVIDQLKLGDNPNFNPELAKPTFWSRVNPMPKLVTWLHDLRGKPKSGEAVDMSLGQRENRLIDIFLSHVDVSLLGRSYVLSVKVDNTDAQTAANIANTLADTYLDYQRADKIATLDRVDKYLMGRVAELRDQVRKSDQAVEQYRRAHGLYKSSNTGVTGQQLTELNSQLIAAQTAKVEAESKLNEAKAVSKGGLGGGESVPDVLRSPLIVQLKAQQADAERKLAEMSAMYGPKYPAMANARAEVGDRKSVVAAEVAKQIDGLAREARTAEARYQALNDNFEKLKSQMGHDNEQSIQLEALE